MALHDDGVVALAKDLASRTTWTVRAAAPGFDPPSGASGMPPDVMCDCGADRRPVVFEVELPETLVRRDTVRRLGALVNGAFDTRLVILAEDGAHDRTIREAEQLLSAVGLDIPVTALAPDSATLTGADW